MSSRGVFALALPSLALTSLVALAGCTLEPTADGLRLQARMPYTGRPQVMAASEPWSGEPIVVDVDHGNVQVVGLRNATAITVRVGTLTWADTKADATRMHENILSKVRVTRDGHRVLVRCTEPDGDFGSALAAASQCNVRVEVPAPEGAVHDVSAFARDGFTYLNRLATDARTQIRATGIQIEGFALRGNVSAYAGWLDVEVEPIPGGSVVVESTTDDWYYIPSLAAVPKREPRDGAAQFGATLRVPRDFRAGRVELFSRGASVEAFAFPDIVNGQPRGPVDATAATLVGVRANEGNATLLPLGDRVTTERTDEFGTDRRDPWGG